MNDPIWDIDLSAKEDNPVVEAILTKPSLKTVVTPLINHTASSSQYVPRSQDFSLRDYIACLAITACITNCTIDSYSAASIAEKAYMVADAMLKERMKSF